MTIIIFLWTVWRARLSVLKFSKPLERFSYLLAILTNLFERLGNPFTKFTNPLERLGNPFAKFTNLFERLGNLFAKFTNPFERLGSPFAKFTNPFKWLDNLFAKFSNSVRMFRLTVLNDLQACLNPFESCLFHLFYGKSLKYVFLCTVTDAQRVVKPPLCFRDSS